MIGSHLLTENLAFPLYMWSVYAIVACAETPSPARQIGALVAIAALGLCRLNLAFMVGVLFVAVIVAEALRRHDEREVPGRVWLRGLARREADHRRGRRDGVVGVAIAIRGGAGVSGRYGGWTSPARSSGCSAPGRGTRCAVLTYLRGLVVGGFVFPVAIGAGVALAGSPAGSAGGS